MAFAGLRKRAARRKVRLHGRMRSNCDWIDLSIRNLSKKGLMAETDDPPGRGHYIEIRRADHIFVGRVVWSSGRCFGVMLSDEVNIDSVVAGFANDNSGGKVPGMERRVHSDRHGSVQILAKPSDWRWLGQLLERASLVLFGAALVGTFAYTSYGAMANSMSAITTALQP
ncbi:hypothetical protein [Croceicoccus mobilis]|uniref:PilZ domain-containing protein n=1 Tax=Croceicoccus mobilis TaxID=1703339 RepID=A0A917DSG3_9SPHN|nr:hypothetical protein [Croceicoccus mobilis]GGD66775.1 hypothetical protein GCM10010990_15380 [Croceicoccus mobilis]